MVFPTPDTEDYGDVRANWVDLAIAGGTLPILVYEPVAAAPRPAIVIGAEGGGINGFIRRLAATLAHLGFVALVPDYYRGESIPDPDTFNELMVELIEGLDFRRAAVDFLETIAFARTMPNVNGKVGVWGYCTGGTVAMFGVCLDRNLEVAVLVYPSQPRFKVTDAKRPVDPIDLVWNIGCPVMFIYGDQDSVMSPEQLAELGERLTEWSVPHDIRIYPGVGHAFSSHGYVNYDRDASARVWEDGLEFIVNYMAPDQSV